MAAMSERLTARAFQPMSAGAAEIRRKWTSSISRSVVASSLCPAGDREHRGVVADAHLDPGRGAGRGGAPPDAADQPALAQSAQAHPFGWLRVHAGMATGVSARKFASSALPWLVRIDSGWNCTPSTG